MMTSSVFLFWDGILVNEYILRPPLDLYWILFSYNDNTHTQVLIRFMLVLYAICHIYIYIYIYIYYLSYIIISTCLRSDNVYSPPSLPLQFIGWKLAQYIFPRVSYQATANWPSCVDVPVSLTLTHSLSLFCVCLERSQFRTAAQQSRIDHALNK